MSNEASSSTAPRKSMKAKRGIEEDQAVDSHEEEVNKNKRHRKDKRECRVFVLKRRKVLPRRDR